jgi:hypothetical protein
MILAIWVFLSAIPFLLLFSLLVWMLLEVLKSKFKNPYLRLVWIVILTFIPIIGMVIYVLIGRKQGLSLT